MTRTDRVLKDLILSFVIISGSTTSQEDEAFPAATASILAGGCYQR